LDVDHRGELGEDKADVLFFSQWSIDQIKQFRSYLLQNDEISKAYNSVEQFEGWTPHLTLGYPGSPAKKDQRDYPGTSWVSFDRIALWTGDFTGPEFPLKTHNWDMEVSMGNLEPSGVGRIETDKILAHHGVKGQKWGVRRAAKKAQRADARFEKKATSFGTKVELHNSVGDVMNQHIGRINAKPEYVKAANDGILENDNHPITKKYTKEYMDVYVREMQKVLDSSPRTLNPSGTKKLVVKEAPEFLGFKVTLKDVKHTDDSTFNVKFVRDDKGMIIGFTLDELQQGMAAVNNILAHHGVKGQKWGVRRNKTTTAVTVKTDPTKKRTKIKARGGQNQPAHADAIGARSTQRVLKKSGVDALSNKDLQDLQTRLNLEQNVTRLDKAQRVQGSHFVVRFLKDPAGRKRIASVANSEDGKKVREALLKKVAKTSVKVGAVAAA
jgi:hypothetical protein